MNKENRKLNPYFNPLGTWAFSIGTSIGWGSFVVTCNTYLLQAGIKGTILGLILGMMIILIVNHNLIYMMQRSQDAGGIYAYGKKIRGNDTGFIIAWFLLLTYLAVLWANITSLPLFARKFIGDIFQFGYCYTVFNYDVYLGEVLLSMAAVLLGALFCARIRKIPQLLMIIMAIIFVGGLSIVTILALSRHGSTAFTFDPQYLPDKTHLEQIIRIAVISPWAFIGFENAAHFSEEFDYPVKKIRNVMVASVVLTTLVYIFMTVLSATAYPAAYPNWMAYIQDMGNLEGLEAIPAFYAAEHYLGGFGVFVMVLSLLTVILTSIIGNLTAISRLLYALGRDGLISARFAKLNDRYIPSNAFMLTAVVSCFIPFLGRTAIGWIVDVTTLGATIIYGFLCYAVFHDARKNNDKNEVITGIVGTALMLFFAVMLLAPKLLSYEAMASESYILFAAWSLVGLGAFRMVLFNDKENKYGRSIIVWVMLLMLMLLTTMMWVNRQTQQLTNDSMNMVEEYYQHYFDNGIKPGSEATEFVKEQIDKISDASSRNMLFSYTLVIIATLTIFNNLRVARRREQQWEIELGIAKQYGLTDALTGIKNKNAYEQYEANIDRQIADGTVEPFAVAVCDINDLKKINDTYGHNAGDESIKRASRTICQTFKKSPVFRYGGDEFVVILQGDDYVNRNELLAELNRKEEDLSNHDEIISIGMAEFDKENHNTLLRVLEIADRNMYDRKKYLKELRKSAE